MPHRVYLAAPLPLLDHARGLAALLVRSGHTVVSTWHAQASDPTVAVEAALDDAAMRVIADACLADLRRASIVVVLLGPKTDRMGNVCEAFFGLALGKTVVTYPVVPDAVLPTRFLLASGIRHAAGIYGPSLELVIADYAAPKANPFGVRGGGSSSEDLP